MQCDLIKGHWNNYWNSSTFYKRKEKKDNVRISQDRIT